VTYLERARAFRFRTAFHFEAALAQSATSIIMAMVSAEWEQNLGLLPGKILENFKFEEIRGEKVRLSP
jgi:hypothetical protein